MFSHIHCLNSLLLCINYIIVNPHKKLFVSLKDMLQTISTTHGKQNYGESTFNHSRPIHVYYICLFIYIFFVKKMCYHKNGYVNIKRRKIIV